MVEQLRLLGISLGLPGAGIMEEFIRQTKKPKDLNSQQRKEVLDAWDTRNYVPEDKLEFVDRVQPDKTLEGEEYEIEYVRLIYQYLQTIWGVKMTPLLTNI